MRFSTWTFLVLLAATIAACRPDGPTGVTPGSSISSITVSPEAAEVPVHGRVQLDATVRDGDGDIQPGRALTWSSSDPEVATVDDGGGVTGVALGSVTITARANGVEGSAGVDVRGFLIGASGGVATSDDGRAWAAVPAGALSGEATVAVEPAGTAALPDGGAAGGFTPGSAYRLEVAGQTFSQPAQLSIRYDRDAVPSEVPESSLRLRRASGGTWAPVQGSSVDVSAAEVRGPVDVSGVYAAVGLSNRPPEVSITGPADGSSFRRGEAVTFSGTATDPEDGELQGGALVWRSDLDGQFGTGRNVTTSGLSIGDHAITLTATDSRGLSGTDGIGIRIENNPPTAAITAPADGSVFLRGQSITFEGRGTDPEDGTLTGGALVWTSDKDGQLGTGRAVTTSALSNGTHRITLRVTDSHGATDTDRIEVRIIGVF